MSQMKRMKMLQNLIKVYLIVLVTVISINFTGCKETQEKPQSEVGQAEQFLSKVKKLREDSKKNKEYFEIMDKLAVLVKEEVKRNPERMESFLEDMIGIAVKAGPGLALEVEDYADTILKQKTEILEKKNSELLSQISAFQKEVVQTKESLRIAKEAKNNFFEEKRKEIRKEIESMDQVPIILGQNTSSFVDFEIISESVVISAVAVAIPTDGKIWTFRVYLNNRYEIVYLLPGKYRFKTRTKEGIECKGELTITRDPSIYYLGGCFHGMIEVPIN